MQQEKLPFETLLANNAPQTEVIDQLTQENQTVIQPNKFIAAGLAALSIYSGYSATHAEAAAQPPAPALLSPSQLEGANDKVSPETRERIKNATVNIVEEIIPATGKTERNTVCTGTKRSSIDEATGTEQIRISTAAHCFGYGLGYIGLTPPVSGFNKKAYNYIDATSTSDGVVNYYLTNPGSSVPIAKVSGISALSLPYKPKESLRDIAELTAEPVTTPLPQGVKSFEQIEAIPDDTYKENLAKLPKPGAEIAFFGTNAINKHAFSGTGIYLGTRIDKEGIFPQKVYLYGVRAKKAKNSMCFSQRSGSAGISESGHVFSPLSTGISRQINLFLRNRQAISNTELAQRQYAVKTTRAEIQKQLKIRLTEFSAICQMQAETPTTDKDLEAGLSTPIAPDVFFPVHKWKKAEY